MTVDKAIEYVKTNDADRENRPWCAMCDAATVLAGEVERLNAMVAAVEALPRVVVRYPAVESDGALPVAGVEHTVVEEKALLAVLHPPEEHES